MAKSPRSIVREHHFEKDLAAVIGDIEAADDFVAGAEWLLAQNPEIGFPIADGFERLVSADGPARRRASGALLHVRRFHRLADFARGNVTFPVRFAYVFAAIISPSFPRSVLESAGIVRRAEIQKQGRASAQGARHA